MEEEQTNQEQTQETTTSKSFPWWVIIIVLLILASAVLWYLINFGIINIPSLSPKQEAATDTATESAVEATPVVEVEEPVETPVATESAEEAEEPEVSDEATDEAIKQAVLDRTGLAEEDVNFTITTKTASHAKGNIREIDAIGGAYWLAARDNGDWIAVYDGQANPPCADINPFDFSTDMVPECMDASNNLVTR